VSNQAIGEQEEPQPKPQVEQENPSQVHIKINHKDNGDLMMKKKKIRRGGRARHRTLIQDAKMMSKNQIEKRNLAQIKCFECGDIGHFVSGCPTELEKKSQATHERLDNGKHNMSKEEKAQAKRMCYSCQERGHMAHSCPLGNTSKPISFDDTNMLRKDGNGTSLVAIAKYPAIHTKAMPKYVAPNLRRTQIYLGTIKKWMKVYRYYGIGGLIQLISY
jgi:hypothetical protein